MQAKLQECWSARQGTQCVRCVDSKILCYWDRPTTTGPFIPPPNPSFIPPHNLETYMWISQSRQFEDLHKICQHQVQSMNALTAAITSETQAIAKCADRMTAALERIPWNALLEAAEVIKSNRQPSSSAGSSRGRGASGRRP